MFNNVLFACSCYNIYYSSVLVGVIGGSDGGESNEDDQGMLVIRKYVLYLQITCMGWSYFCLNSDSGFYTTFALQDVC